jgi:hypothetical protein
MTAEEYKMFDRQVERKMKHVDGWFTVGWDQMRAVCDDKVNAGTLEKRWNAEAARIEYRAL